MSFCPRCGAPTTPQMSFCTSCGESLAKVVYTDAPAGTPSAPTYPLPGAAPPPSGRPVGMTQEPWLAVILTLVTFGIYGFFYWWRVSKEADAYAARPGHSHKPIRIAAIVALVSIVAAFFLFFVFMGTLFSGALEGGGEGAALGAFAGAMLLFPLVFVGWIAALILWLVGQYRVWRIIEEDERARRRPDPLSPGLQLLFVLLPYVNFVTGFIALYKTQERLNLMWATQRG